VNTPSHAIIAAALRQALPQFRIPLSAVLWGSIAPDIPLFVLTLDHMLGTRYLRDPLWLTARTALHAPLVIAAVLLVALTVGRRRVWGRWLAWFAAACALHTLLDIITHVDDGPLLLFPFDRTVRFHSPVSYWDPRFHGRAFTVLEVSLDLCLLVYLVAAWRRSRAVSAVLR
jgi:membrane-bound metal-dependent hydrolase YbcI (DUF457 family)